jgi:hypothetical protein
MDDGIKLIHNDELIHSLLVNEVLAVTFKS